jgi:hypothetical protein
MLSDKTLQYGEEICAVTLGVDHLYRKEIGVGVNDPHEGLAVINMGNVPAREFESYDDARKALSELAKKAFSLPEEDRRLYYNQACISMDSFCASRMGLLPSLTSQIGMFLHVNPAPVSDRELDGFKQQIRTMLTQMGYSGDLEQQCAKWEEKNKVPADEVKGVMEELMVEARKLTGEILDLPEGDYYSVITERGCSFSASSHYDERAVIINIDPVLTKPSLKHLVCHECYPGHFMQFSLRQRLYEKGVAAADGLLSVCNHSSSATFEGIADAGLEFIDWIKDDDDRVMLLLSELKSSLGTAASYKLHEMKMPASEVENWIRSNALIGGEGYVTSRMRFISDTSRSALIWSYWRGDQGVFDIWHRVEPKDRPRFFDYIYSRLHTVQSMQLFR